MAGFGFAAALGFGFAAADLVIPNHGDLDTLRGVAMRALPLLRVGATA